MKSPALGCQEATVARIVSIEISARDSAGSEGRELEQGREHSLGAPLGPFALAHPARELQGDAAPLPDISKLEVAHVSFCGLPRTRSFESQCQNTKMSQSLYI